MDPLTISALLIPTGIAITSLARGLGDTVVVGTRYGIPYRLPLDKHLCILGPTRVGKSSLVRAMVNRLSRKYVVTVFDWHGEYAGLLTTIPISGIKVNLRDIPPKLLTEILGFGLNLNEPSMYLLYRIIKDGDYENLNDIITKVDNYLVNTRAEAEMKAGILRRLEYVAGNMGNGIIDVQTITKADAVLDLSDLTIIEEKRLVMAFILASIYVHYMRSGIISKGVKHVLIIEEAQNLINNDSTSFTIIDHLLMETGKYGVRAILVSNIIPKTSLLKHCNIIMFKIKPEFLEGGMSMSDELIRKLNEITPEEALVITNNDVIKIRPLRAPLIRSHVIIRPQTSKPVVVENKFGSEYIDENKNKVSSSNNDNHDVNLKPLSKPSVRDNARVAEGDGNNSLMVRVLNDVPGDSLFKKQLVDLENEVLSLKDRVNEIERILQADEKLIERILDVDYKLKERVKE